MCDCGCSSSVTDQVTAVCDKYGCEVRYLIPILHDLQSSFGWISNEVMENVAESLGTTVSHVHGVTTFYSLFYTKVQGQNVVRICSSTPCHIGGSHKLQEAIKSELGISPGETSKDGKFSFEKVSCMGLCGVAPAIMVNDDVYGNLTAEQVPSILSKYREEA